MPTLLLDERTRRPSPLWKGDDVAYKTLHAWVRRHKGDPEICVDCGSFENLEWSNTNGEYARRLSDFAGRCVPCHRQFDRRPEMRGAIRRKWGTYGSVKTNQV